MIYVLAEMEDKDREDPTIDVFSNRRDAEAYAAELGYGTVSEYMDYDHACLDPQEWPLTSWKAGDK